MSMLDLVKFWSGCNLDVRPCVHEKDRPFIAAQKRIGVTNLPSHNAYVEHATFSDDEDSSLHLSLLPVPYQGHLAAADIFVVMLNPGLSRSDYQAEEDEPHAEQVKKIIRQDFSGVPYPFLSLNPEFAWTSGFKWWEEKLRKTLKVIADDRHVSYLEAMWILSQRLAAIEIFPYHSRVFKAAALRDKLPSVQAARKFVQDLVPRAEAGEISIIISRGIKTVGVNDHTITNHNPKDVRGASLGPNSLGGKAIVDAIRKRP